MTYNYRVKILPEKPTHGFDSWHLLILALIDSGLLLPKNWREKRTENYLDDQVFDLTSREVNELLITYLRKRDG